MYRVLLKFIKRICFALPLLSFSLQKCFTNKWKTESAIESTVSSYITYVEYILCNIYIPRHTWRAQDRCAKSQWQVRGSYSPNTITRVILTVLTLALGISPRDDTLLVSLVGPWRNAPPCDHIVATITA